MVPKDIAIKLANNPAPKLIDSNREAYRVPQPVRGRVKPCPELLKLEMMENNKKK